jgi:hypothetical protein
MQGLTSVHTLYYYHPSELPSIIDATKGKMMYAIMHRFVGQQGEMNNGEQTWRRYTDETGRSMIEQTNKLTGSKYVHADNERWFQNNSWSPYRGMEAAGHMDEQALVWDINTVASGVYVLRIASCTVREALLDTTWVAPKVDAPMVKNSAAYVKQYSKVVIENPMSGPEEIAIPPTYQPLFNDLRLRMVGATRDTKKYSAHAQYSALKVKGVMKEVGGLDDIQLIYDLVYASFWVDHARDRKESAFLGKDFRTTVLDLIIVTATSKTALAGFAEGLRSIRHRM